MLLKHFICLEYQRGIAICLETRVCSFNFIYDFCVLLMARYGSTRNILIFMFCRLEFDLAMKSNDLKRALHCLLTMSNSRDIGQDDTPGLGLNDILNLSDKKQEKISDKKKDMVDGVQGIVKFAKEFLDLIDAADATAQSDIAREALKRLAAAGSVKGALEGHELRGLALRLANHGELTRLSVGSLS